METTVNSRILMLKTHLGLADIEFCNRGSISTGTLSNIKNDANVSKKTIKSICAGFNVNENWLLQGKGKMFKEIEEKVIANPYQDALYKELRDQIDFLKEMVRMLGGGKPANFLTALNGTGTRKRVSLRVAA